MRARYKTPNSHAENIAYEIGLTIVLGGFNHLGKLPSDFEFAQQFGVSRNVIREAFSFLNSKNLVIRKASRGTMINDEDRWDLLDKDILNWITQRRFSIDLLNELNQVRYSIEPLAAVLSAREHNLDKLEKLDSTINKIRCNKDGLQGLGALLTDFHIEVLLCSQNRFYSHTSHFIEAALAYQFKAVYSKRNQVLLDVALYTELVHFMKNNNVKRTKLTMQKILLHEFSLVEIAGHDR